MLDHLLPRTIDNDYRGRKAALWLLGLLLLMKTAMGLNSILNGYKVATSADGIPLDSYPPAAARTIVALFGIWGLGHFMICLLGILVLARYRKMVPFMFALFLVEQLSRKLILQIHPIVRVGNSPASAINLALLALTVVGLALSIWRRGNVQGRNSPD
jgi:hypothetical protein